MYNFWEIPHEAKTWTDVLMKYCRKVPLVSCCMNTSHLGAFMRPNWNTCTLLYGLSFVLFCSGLLMLLKTNPGQKGLGNNEKMHETLWRLKIARPSPGLGSDDPHNKPPSCLPASHVSLSESPESVPKLCVPQGKELLMCQETSESDKGNK